MERSLSYLAETMVRKINYHARRIIYYPSQKAEPVIFSFSGFNKKFNMADEIPHDWPMKTWIDQKESTIICVQFFWPFLFFMELSKELDEIDTELKEIEAQIESLLERQQFLQSRKELIQSQICCSGLDTREPCSSVQKDENSPNWSANNFSWSEMVETAREDIFKIKKFRPLQLECINATMAGTDCILIMPTGGGKSLCFQLPAVISKGVTLVVSPLISLIEDQIMALSELKIESSFLNSNCSKDEVNAVHNAMVDKTSDLKLLYVTPEKIAKSKRFMAKLEKTYEGKFIAIMLCWKNMFA